MYDREREVRGSFLIVGVGLASVLAYHFAGGLGVVGVLAVYCVWRAI